MRSFFKCLWQVSSTESTQKKAEKYLFENLTHGQLGYNGKQELTSQQKWRTNQDIFICDTIEKGASWQHSLGHDERVKARKKTAMSIKIQDLKSLDKSFKCFSYKIKQSSERCYSKTNYKNKKELSQEEVQGDHVRWIWAFMKGKVTQNVS